MIDIVGIDVSDICAYAALIGGAVGAILSAYVLYVVAKVEHDGKVEDERLEALKAGEEFPQWKIEKAAKWYKAYKLALVAEIIVAFIIGLASCVVALHAGWISGVVGFAAVGIVGALVGGFVADVKVIHKIADRKFQKDVEIPLVEGVFHVVEDADPEKMKEEAEQKELNEFMKMYQLFKQMKE